MNGKYQPGQKVFLTGGNKNLIKEATVLKYTGGFYTIRFENGGGIKVRESRIYPTRKEAEAAILNRARNRNLSERMNSEKSKKMNIEYRLGTKQDLNAICSLIQQAIDEMERHGIYQWDDIYPARKDFEEDIEKKTLYLAYVEGNLAALYVISGECDEQYRNGQWKYEERSAFVLHRFCVSPFFQNQGIGRAVLKHIEEQVKAMGYNSIRLDTFTENPFAQKLYLHNGYESRGYADWRKGRFDLMEKKL